GDVLMSAIFAAACKALAEIAESLSRDRAELDELSGRFSTGVQSAWDPDLRLALDWDVVAGQPVRVETCAGLAPLLLPTLSTRLLPEVVERLTGPGFAGAEGFAYRAVPSTAPGSTGFAARAYWRGPSWPVANWLFWFGLAQHAQQDAAENL